MFRLSRFLMTKNGLKLNPTWIALGQVHILASSLLNKAARPAHISFTFPKVGLAFQQFPSDADYYSHKKFLREKEPARSKMEAALISTVRATPDWNSRTHI
ncbi:hypothetical protein SLE2022_089530 [Rubroshorea leprosula]